jgi:hypothetical protein
MIDDEDLNWTFFRFQLEPELFLHGREYIRPRINRQGLIPVARRLRSGCICPLQLEVVTPFEPSLIRNGASQYIGKSIASDPIFSF